MQLLFTKPNSIFIILKKAKIECNSYIFRNKLIENIFVSQG